MFKGILRRRKFKRLLYGNSLQTLHADAFTMAFLMHEEILQNHMVFDGSDYRVDEEEFVMSYLYKCSDGRCFYLNLYFSNYDHYYAVIVSSAGDTVQYEFQSYEDVFELLDKFVDISV